LNTLLKAESLSGGELEKTHEELLGQLLRHAYAQVPYYKKVLDGLGGESLFRDFSPSAILRQMPILTKTIMRNQMQELVPEDLETRKWYLNASGGSTGEPVRLIQDKTYQLWSVAVKSLYDVWTDYQPGMSKVILWGSERDLLVGKETIKTHVGRWLRNERWLNAFRMTEGDMRKYVQIINESRPAQILAYVEAVYELCRFIEEEGLSVHSPSAIMTSAGTLYPQMRATIEKVFRTRVFNRYGSREVGDIACECEQHGGLHISPLTHYVEILSEDGRPAAPGQTG
jgi:phenylacetate-CoA ligase